MQLGDTNWEDYAQYGDCTLSEYLDEDEENPARNELALQIRQALVDVGAIGDPDQLDQYAEGVVEQLCRWRHDADTEGWLISRGDVYVLLETDRDGTDDGRSFGTYVARGAT